MLHFQRARLPPSCREFRGKNNSDWNTSARKTIRDTTTVNSSSMEKGSMDAHLKEKIVTATLSLLVMHLDAEN
jgi:hypothetical protein